MTLLKEKLFQHKSPKIPVTQDSKDFSLQESITGRKTLWYCCMLKTEFMSLFVVYLMTFAVTQNVYT
jgi:hypothetical protein